MKNYNQKPNFYAFARRLSAHCEQDESYEILSKTKEGKAYRLKDELMGVTKVDYDDFN
jgi:hypothetical protein